MFLELQWRYFMEGWGRQYRGKASYGCWIVSLVIWNWHHLRKQTPHAGIWRNTRYQSNKEAAIRESDVLKRYRMLVLQEPRCGASEKWIFCTPFGEKVHGTNRLSSQTQLGYFKLLHQTTHCHNSYEGWDLQRCHQPFHIHLCCSGDSKMSLAFHTHLCCSVDSQRQGKAQKFASQVQCWAFMAYPGP